MSDVIDGGGRRRTVPRWLWVVAGAVAAAALIVVAVTRSRPDHRVAPKPPGSAVPSPSSTSTPQAATGAQPVTGSPLASAAGWPHAQGACGSDALLPQRTLTLHYNNVAGTVLVGGTRLQTVRLNQPSASPVPGGPDRTGLLVDTVVAGPDAGYAQIAQCDASTGGTGALYRIEAGVAHPLAASGDQLLAGVHHAWAVRFPRRAHRL